MAYIHLTVLDIAMLYIEVHLDSRSQECLDIKAVHTLNPQYHDSVVKSVQLPNNKHNKYWFAKKMDN